MTVILRAGAHEIVYEERGERIELEDFGYLRVPGEPLLPAKRFLVALPPGARVLSIEARALGETELPGTHRIIPTPPLVPLSNVPDSPETSANERGGRFLSGAGAHSSDDPYPALIVELSGYGTLRKYAYASVSFCPFRYLPRSGRLLRYEAAEVDIHYALPPAGSSTEEYVQKLKWDTVADDDASRLFSNYDEIAYLYEPGRSGPPQPTEHFDYVIVTTAALVGAVESSEFVSWKAALGYDIRIVLTTDPEIAGQEGRDLAERIREFLREYYAEWGIEYVLVVGGFGMVPMRYCFPNPDDHSHNPNNPSNCGASVPTDSYYADLSWSDDESWDSDGDGYYGEYGDDAPDFLAEVYVGRIPTSNHAQIAYTLDKSVIFEQDTGTWKDQALQLGAICEYENQDHTGHPKFDGVRSLATMEADFMQGWMVSHYSEQQGLDPSDYLWPALSMDAVTADWRSGRYGIVNWVAHGSPQRVVQYIWVWDDGDGVPETDGSDVMSYPAFMADYADLEDDYPSIVFANSCKVGYPEPNGDGNLGVDLLTLPGFGASAGVVSAARDVYAAYSWEPVGGGSESICYEFNRFMIDGPDGPESVGSALYQAKHYANQNYGWDSYTEYINLYGFNLYGDPALDRRGVPVVGIDAGERLANLGAPILLQNYPNPFNPTTEIPYVVRSSGWVRLEIFNLLGQRVATLVDGPQTAGHRTVRWDSRGDAGNPVESGVYFYRIETRDREASRSMTILR